MEMDTRQYCRLTLLFTLIASCSVAEEHIPPSSMRSEAIVKFVDGSLINDEINASVNDDWTLTSGIYAHAQELSEQLGTPFVVSRITSGRELLLTILMDKMQNELISHVIQHSDVKDAAPLMDTDSSPNRPLAVRIVFVTGSPSHQAILEEGDDDSGEITAIAESLVADFPHATTAQAVPPDQLVLDLDSRAITRKFVEQLRALEVVAYAQPNFIFKH